MASKRELEELKADLDLFMDGTMLLGSVASGKYRLMIVSFGVSVANDVTLDEPFEVKIGLLQEQDFLLIYHFALIRDFVDTDLDLRCAHMRRGRKVDPTFNRVWKDEYIPCFGHRLNYRQAMQIITIRS